MFDFLTPEFIVGMIWITIISILLFIETKEDNKKEKKWRDEIKTKEGNKHV